VHYCDGSLFSSYRPNPIPTSKGDMWFRGKANLAAIFDELLAVQVRCAFFTMGSAVLRLAALGCGCCTVRVSRQKSTLEDYIAIEPHGFAPLEAMPCV